MSIARAVRLGVHTIGNVDGATCAEYVWNDSWQGGSGATGGGVSARFLPPSYQANANLPKRNATGTAGRGIPDISGNASVNSGYPIYVGGQSPGPTGPANNSFDGTVGYPATAGWNACTGLGSVNGTAVQEGIQKAHG